MKYKHNIKAYKSITTIAITITIEIETNINHSNTAIVTNIIITIIRILDNNQIKMTTIILIIKLTIIAVIIITITITTTIITITTAIKIIAYLSIIENTT